MDIVDLIGAAQKGVLEAIAKEYGLAPEQLTLAIESLAPAYAAAVNSAMRSYGDADFDPKKAFDFPWVVSGFGPDDVSRRIAELASSATGINEQAIQRLMPVMAAAFLGGAAGWPAAFGDNNEESDRPKGPLDKYEEEQARKSDWTAGVDQFARMMDQMAAAWSPTARDNNAAPESFPSGEAFMNWLMESQKRMGEEYCRAMQDIIAGKSK